jgi:hypothetical protein
MPVRAAATVEHVIPCKDLVDLRDDVRRLSEQVNDPDSGLGAHTQALKNGVAWQGRIEDRVNQLYYIGLGTLVSLITGLVLLLLGKA